MVEYPCSYKWWSTRAVLKAHHWFRAIQDPRNQTLTSLCLQSSSKKDNRCFVCFFNRFGSFAFIKAGLWTHRFAAYPRPEKFASPRSSYLEFAQFGSLAHPQSYRSRSAYLECTHLSTSISEHIISCPLPRRSRHSKGMRSTQGTLKDNRKDFIVRTFNRQTLNYAL